MSLLWTDGDRHIPCDYRIYDKADARTKNDHFGDMIRAAHMRGTEYMDQLTGLRDRLRVALSGTPADGEPTTGELAEQINALKASHEVEAAPAGTRATKPRAETVRRRPEVEKPVDEGKAEETKPVGEKPDAPPDDDSPPSVPFQQRVRKGVQLRLFWDRKSAT